MLLVKKKVTVEPWNIEANKPNHNTIELQAEQRIIAHRSQTRLSLVYSTRFRTMLFMMIMGERPGKDPPATATWGPGDLTMSSESVWSITFWYPELASGKEKKTKQNKTLIETPPPLFSFCAKILKSNFGNICKGNREITA